MNRLHLIVCVSGMCPPVLIYWITFFKCSFKQWRSTDAGAKEGTKTVCPQGGSNKPKMIPTGARSRGEQVQYVREANHDHVGPSCMPSAF